MLSYKNPTSPIDVKLAMHNYLKVDYSSTAFEREFDAALQRIFTGSTCPIGFSPIIQNTKS
jgi:hypothetical protein